MDKQELIEFLDGEIRSVKDNIAFKEGMNWCAQLVERYLDLNDEPEITTEQAWEKIAEIFDDDDPDMLKDVCMNVLKAFNGGYPMLVTEGHICTWNPDVGKPEIPHRTAVKIESLRDAGKSDSTIYWNFFGDEEMVEWANDNADTLMQALVNGYTEKAPVWIVKAPYDRYFGGFLEKGQHAEINFSHINRDNAQKFEDKSKAVAVATLVDGEVEEWSE